MPMSGFRPLVSLSEKSRPAGPRALPWVGAGAALAIVIAIGALTLRGDGATGTETAVSLTGRLAFFFFWPSYVGSASVTLFGEALQPLKRRARALGLAFSAVIVVHLTLISWLCWIGKAPPLQTFIVFGLAAFWVVLLVLCSAERIGRALGKLGWWVLRNIGMNYIALVFALDFVRLHPPTFLKEVEYLPFAAMSVSGPLLLLAAWIRQFHNPRVAGIRASPKRT
jgi:hypothetical protein